MCTKGELSAKSQEQRLRNYDPANNLASKVTIAVYIYFLFSLQLSHTVLGGIGPMDWSKMRQVRLQDLLFISLMLKDIFLSTDQGDGEDII